MKTRSETIRSNNIKLYLILAMTLVIATIMGFMFIASQKSLDIPKAISTSKNESGSQAIFKQDDDQTVAAFYPLIADKAISEQLVNYIENAISTEKDHKYIYIDYDLYQVTDQYTSIAFYLAQGDDVDELKPSLYSTLTFAMDTKKIITLDDLFKPDHKKAMIALLRETMKNDPNFKDKLRADFYHMTKLDVLMFDNFVLIDDHIQLLMDSKDLLNEDEGTINVNLDINRLAYYLHEDYRAIITIKPAIEKDLTLRYIDPDKPMIALTYDDGPYGPVTDKIVATLVEHESAATFFIVGNRIRANAETLRKMLLGGNEIGNHSYTHKYNLTTLGLDQLDEELSPVQSDLYHYVADYKIRLLRPTGGNNDQTLRDNCGYPLIIWDVDTKDWRHHQSQKTYDEVVNVAKDGDIVIMHDIYESTAEATAKAVPELIRMGYQLVTVSELFEYKGVTMENGNVYYSSDRYTK